MPLKGVLPQGDGTTPLNVVATLQKNLESLGFLLPRTWSKRSSERAQYRWKPSTAADQRFSAMVGANWPFYPMYPNFPAQVMEMTEAELYFNAFVHYWTLELPETEPEERRAAAGQAKAPAHRLGTREDFEGIFILLARSKSPFSPQDKDDAKWFVAQYRDGIMRLLPDQYCARRTSPSWRVELDPKRTEPTSFCVT